MNDFEFYSPTRFVFGRGVTDAVGQHVAKLGYKRALLVYGGGSVVRTGTLARVKESLAKAGIEFVELSGVRPNPEVASVREGIAVARENDDGHWNSPAPIFYVQNRLPFRSTAYHRFLSKY